MVYIYIFVMKFHKVSNSKGYRVSRVVDNTEMARRSFIKYRSIFVIITET